MATKNDGLNLGKDKQPGSPAGKKGKGGMKKIVIIVLVVVLFLAVGGGAAFFMMGDSDNPGSGEQVDEVVEQQAVEEREPIYLPLDPAFVVNFEHKGTIRYLQLSLQVMAYDQKVVDKIQANMPAVRNSLILLFSGQDYDLLNTLEGKEQLRTTVRQSIQDVIRLKGEQKVDDVFFTGFVMQ
ncbi:flagellar basal body-associated FliL family protein [Porticoccus sp.]|jgi:flagellar FliL protein|uniref:flagellar basal body-associated FliL family protein n=1 Tax=Porticoccus sp. TaxID=2024853 RepID=UPI000C50E6EB|nr:flagellar basal body-associated FliL family protein [Porticoccus sp.]MAZ70628.1 hypothetical protein [Porticoccus sp.]|tara:strand:+ start:28494 stop:29039 length:546 start_codon:yes stop_codon:yes gene_type:complete